MRLKVMVLSSDERVRGAAEALPSTRFEVSFHPDVLALLEASKRESFDIALLDLIESGFAAAKDIRARQDGGSVLIVMLCERDQDRWLCLQSGADAVITKPIPDTSTLLRGIEAGAAATRAS